jgi:hypothetical protein
MRSLFLVAVLGIAMLGFFRCNQASHPTAIHEPEWNANVKDTDPCQAVREQKMGGVIVFCKGKCPSEQSKCGTLKSRKRGTENPWKEDDGSTYDSGLEYRCSCVRG